jgi:hypothetical protein
MKKFASIALGVVVVGFLVWLAIFVIRMAILLLPLALILLGGYMSYKYLKGKSTI